MNTDEKFKRVHIILNEKWNPIGISLENCDDEYDTYAQHIAQQPTWKEADLIKYLVYIEGTIIGMPVNAQTRRRAAEVARELLAGALV